MEEKSEKPTIGERINTGSGMILVAIAFFTFVLLLPSTINSVGRITQIGPEITGIAGFTLTPSQIYLYISISLVLVLVSILSLFMHNEKISNSFSRDKTRQFYGFLMIYILVQLILTEVYSYALPNLSTIFPFQEALGVQNFYFLFLTLDQSVLFVFVPVTAILAVVGLMRGESLSRHLRFYGGSWSQVLLISLAVSLVSTFFISATPLEFISNFTSLAVLNIIFLRYGFLKAFLTGFSVSMTNVTASVIGGNLALSIILPLFLFFLGFLGVYALVQFSVSAPKGEESNEELEEQKQIEVKKRPQIAPFIYSRCPQCGNTVYHVLPSDMSLKCEKCDYIMPSDAIGPKNISIEFSRTSRS